LNKILITGGAGFIGSNLCRYLSDKDYNNIVVMDNLSTGDKNRISQCIIESDVMNLSEAVYATNDVDIVIHLAAQIDVMNSISNPFNDMYNNVLGTLNVLQACMINGVKKFILASSNAVPGDNLPPVNEGIAPKPMSPYGASKLAGEGYCSAFYYSYGLETVALRFANAYGPGALNQEGVVSLFMKQILKDGSVTVFGDGKQTRDFVYVDDICQAIYKAMIMSNIGGKVFQVATEIETSILELINLIEKIYGKDVVKNFKDTRKGEIRENYSDISLARKVLNFEPKWSLNEGLKETFNWFEENYHSEN